MTRTAGEVDVLAYYAGQGPFTDPEAYARLFDGLPADIPTLCRVVQELVDHWIVQYWRSAGRRWVMVDAQLDALQRGKLRIDFDTTDLPPGRFVPAGRAWRMVREGKADPEKFGILGMSGPWFVRGNVVRDLLALNKLEVSPWDSWRLATRDDDALTDAQLEWCDRIAAVTQGDDVDLAEVRAIYDTVEDVRLPPWLP